MNRTIYILPDAYAVAEDNRLVEYFPADPESQSGDILIARIGRIMAGMECAFADIAKGAFLSRDLSLPGKNVILMPMNRYIGVSNRIADPDERNRLRQIPALQLRPFRYRSDQAGIS